MNSILVLVSGCAVIFASRPYGHPAIFLIWSAVFYLYSLTLWIKTNEK